MHNILFRDLEGALIDMIHFVRRSQTRTQSLFKCFFGGERRLGIRLRRAQGLLP